MPVNNYITASCTINKNVVYKDDIMLFENRQAPVMDFLLSAYQHLEIKYPKFYKMDGLSKLGWLAAEVLLTGNFAPDKYRAENIGVVLCNASTS